MRIVFDAYELFPGPGKSIGIYNYAKNLLKALIQVIDDDTEIFVICNTSNISDFNYDHKAVTNIIISKSPPGKIARIAWIYGQAALIIKKIKADVYFSPKGFLPKGISFLSPQTKTVVVIHDLIPLWYAEHFPGYFGWMEEMFINNLQKSSVKYSDRLIAISQATADDIALRLRRTKGISILYNGIPITKAGTRPFEKPYIFAMASHLPHKNYDGLLAAYRAYRAIEDAPLPLIICGVSESNQLGVITVKGLDDATLHAYYAYADLFIFLSLIEGFGFPPVEALAHGTPVICSDIPSLREITKGFANYVPPTLPEVVGKQIAQVLSQDTSVSIKEERKNIINEYTWHSCATGILNVIKSSE